MVIVLGLRPINLILLVIATCFLSLAGHLSTGLAQAKDQQKHDLPNFHQVEPFLFRGGQPRGKGLERLKQMGIKTIIDLRGGKQPLKEQAECDKLELRFVSIPLSHHHAPAANDVQKFLQIVEEAKQNPNNGAVFVHCREGKDRTGCLIALYRVKKDGWAFRQACDEMLKFGFHPIFRELTKSVKAADQNKVQSTSTVGEK